MKESAVWKALRPLFKGLDPVRVENPAGPGTPDVNLTIGWIELKELDEQEINPVRGGIVRLPLFRPFQRVWLLRRWRAGGSAWVFLKGGPFWFLFEGEWAAMNLGKVNLQALQEGAAACGLWPIDDPEELLRPIRERHAGSYGR